MEIATRLSAETALLRSRLETLTRQAATGQRTERLGELAPELPRAISLRAELGRRETYDRVLTQAQGRAAVMQESLGRLREIAREFRANVLPRLYSADPVLLSSARSQARLALTDMAHLLNLRQAGEYLFSGQDIGNPPIPDPEGLAGGQMAQDIAAQVAALGTAGAAAVIAATRGIAQSNAPGVSPFSAHLQAQEALPPAEREARRAAPAADGELIAYGLTADRNGEAQSRGETTGSWARDLMRNLMSVAALDDSLPAEGEEWAALLAGIRDGFAAAETALAEESGALGQAAARMGSAQRRHRDVSDQLRQQLAAIEEVDLAAALERMQATRTALEASYRAIASLSELTLARFLR
ncbi:flagellin [Rubritepida flocculans]|uniref:flagellin n=1 Tax=Rubritepida flocculans TaxID=182403 RepID=UPI000409511F|nr:flagellin [Rubritepida flocculans]